MGQGELLSNEQVGLSKEEISEFTRQVLGRGMGLLRISILSLEVSEYERTEEKGYEKDEDGFHVFLTLSENVINRFGFRSPREVQIVYELVIFVLRDTSENMKNRINNSLLEQRKAVAADVVRWGTCD